MTLTKSRIYMSYRKLLYAGLAAVFLFASASACDSSKTDSDADDDVPDLPGWTLVWNDEFEGDGLPDSDKWVYDVGGHGWGNNELQTYYARNAETARVEDGVLIIRASLVGEGPSKEYKSARMKTAGKGDWVYGRVEVRADLPSGLGTWPAIWMLPSDNAYGGWPNSGEIDIMEHVGFDPNVVHGTVHTGAFNHSIGTHKGGQIQVSGATDGFNVYAIEWSEEKIDFFVNGERYFTFENTDGGPPEWPFDQRFHLVMNIAIGGNWGGQHGVDDIIFPQEMRVDYVRVYEPA